MKIIDLRSDTVTKPSKAMRTVMSQAEVGDDVYGDDPTVNRLESYGAEKLGFEAAIFTASGTQANLISIMSHCGRGDEYIVGQLAHTYKYEGGGAAVLGSIQPQPIEFEPDSTLDLAKVNDKIKPNDIHFAKTRLLCIENTQNGKALPLEYMQQAAQFTKEKHLSLHLDGARLFHAVVKQNIEVQQITQHVDSVSICLSKGLGAPVGSLLCGPKNFIEDARRWRKMTGGGMRQAGIIAAAGLYALENNIDRLKQDHEHARILTEELSKIPELKVERNDAQTNMVFFTAEEATALNLADYLEKENILITGGKTTRLVTHLDISREDITTIVQKIADYFQSAGFR